jgi:hypothetical protein
MLSLCAGEARDVVGALTGHERAPDVCGTLIEINPQLAQDAEANIASAGLSLSVRCGDASETATYSDVVPVDVLLLVGIFGNIIDDDIATTIAAVPALCKPGATVIWTRHRRKPDVTPQIREWFDQANCSSIDFHSPGLGSFAVASERLHAGVPGVLLPATLFTFTD